MKRGAEIDQISGERQQRAKKLPVNSDRDRGVLLLGPFAIKYEDGLITEREHSKPLS